MPHTTLPVKCQVSKFKHWYRGNFGITRALGIHENLCLRLYIRRSCYSAVLSINNTKQSEIIWIGTVEKTCLLVLADILLNIRSSLYTSFRNCDSHWPHTFRSRHGWVLVVCQSSLDVCCLRFLCIVDKTLGIIGGTGYSGHTSSAPKIHDSEVNHGQTYSLRDHDDNRNLERHLCTVIWDAHCHQEQIATSLRPCHTVFLPYLNFTSPDAKLGALKFNIRRLDNRAKAVSVEICSLESITIGHRRADKIHSGATINRCYYRH